MGGKGSGAKPGAKNAWGSRTKPAPMAQDNVGPKNSAIIRFSLALAALPEVDRADEGQVEGRIVEYFEMCDEWQMKPTIEGLSLALGINRGTFFSMLRDNKPYVGLTANTFALLQKAYDVMQQLWSQNFVEDGGNPVKHIFLGKNNFGYTDQTERIERHVVEQRALPTPEEAAARYAGKIGVEIPVEAVVEDAPRLSDG